MSDYISKSTANHVLNYFNASEGCSPGSFGTSLLKAIAHADTQNKYRLGLGFPEEVLAMRLAGEKLDGLIMLRSIANGEEVVL